MDDKHMKIVKQSLAIGEMKIKSAVMSHLTPCQMAHVQKAGTVGAGGKGKLYTINENGN